MFNNDRWGDEAVAKVGANQIQPRKQNACTERSLWMDDDDDQFPRLKRGKSLCKHICSGVKIRRFQIEASSNSKPTPLVANKHRLGLKERRLQRYSLPFPPNHKTRFHFLGIQTPKRKGKDSRRRMCCGTKMCMFCTCLILVVILIGFLFGFGVFKDGFHKLKDVIHDCQLDFNASHCASSPRPLLGFPAPPPY